ncbi:MAG: 6-bladed beta-propeller [Candidatus Latescibacterota bacterium]|nr:MAG: 6-bladed beta-propeller [Candidatus Latescibacterota bacterium]
MKRVMLFCYLSPIVLAAPALAQWKGEEVVQEGVRHVINPEEPIEEVRIELEELWRRGGEDDDVLFGLVSQLVQDDEENIYLLDGQLSEIQVFSPDGEHVDTIGREGEGPGEFRNASDMYRGPGDVLGVLQIFPGRIVQLTTDGSPAGNFPLPEVEGGGFQLVFTGRGNAERVVLAGAQQHMEGGQQIQVTYLKAFDADGNEIVHYHDESQETRFGGMKFQEKKFSNFSRRWALAPDGRVACAVDFDDYKIHVWAPDGSVEYVIDRPGYTPITRTDAQKKRFQKLFDGITRWNPNSTFELSPTHLTVGQMWFREDGSLWVLASRGTWEPESGVFASIDVYDARGRYVQQVHLVMDGDPVEDGIFFVGDRLYLVTDLFSALMANFGGDEQEELEEEPEPVQVVAFRLQGPAIGMK